MRDIEAIRAEIKIANAAHRALPPTTDPDTRYASAQRTGDLARELAAALDAGPDAYVVESLATSENAAGAPTGLHGVFRLVVATEARAIEVASAQPGRQWRRCKLHEVPEPARANIARVMGV